MKLKRFVLPLALFILSGVLAYVGTYCLPETDRVVFEMWLTFFCVITSILILLSFVWAFGGFND